jgi:hypothetical protein
MKVSWLKFSDSQTFTLLQLGLKAIDKLPNHLLMGVFGT